MNEGFTRNALRAWPAILLAIVALAAIAVHRHRERETDAAAARDLAARTQEPTAAKAPGRVPASATIDAGALAPLVDAGARTAAVTPATDAGAPNPAALMMRLTDDADRTFLTEVERHTHTTPPPAVHELLALRRSGATPQTLERFITERLAKPIPLRFAAMRWLHAIAPPPELVPSAGTGAAPALRGGAASENPIPPAFGQGGGARRLHPVDSRSAR